MLKQKGYDLDGEIKNLFNKLDAIDGDREFINDVLEDLRESVDIIGAGSDKYYIRFRQAHENMNLMVAEEGGLITINDLDKTMDYMELKYDLNARDVKACITKILN